MKPCDHYAVEGCFRYKELLSPDLIEYINSKDGGVDPEWYIPEDLKYLLEELREWYEDWIFINTETHPHRGICTTQENQSVGRSIASLHNFCAIDIVPRYQKDLVNVYDWLKKHYARFDIGCIGINSSAGFIHIDFRNNYGGLLELKY